MRVEWTDPALLDLAAHVAYIDQFNPRATDNKLEVNYPDEFIAEILEGVISYERQ